MAAPINVEVGLSASASSGASAGGGPFTVNSGGGSNFWLVVGAVAVFAILAYVAFGKKK